MKLTDLMNEDTEPCTPALICHGGLGCRSLKCSRKILVKHLDEIEILQNAWYEYQEKQRQLDWERQERIRLAQSNCRCCGGKHTMIKGRSYNMDEDAAGSDEQEVYARCSQCNFHVTIEYS